VSQNQADPFGHLWPIQDREQPDWNLWNPRPIVQLWEAAALSIDISTQLFNSQTSRKGHEASWGFNGRITLFPETARGVLITSAFNDRLETLVRASRAGLLGPSIGDDVADEALRAFSHEAVHGFLSRADLALPQGWMPKTYGGAAVSDRWPWGGYETEMLRHLKAAAIHWWIPYHEGKAAKAPTQKIVADWLTREFRISNKKADAIALILHTDDPLPKGPRR